MVVFDDLSGGHHDAVHDEAVLQVGDVANASAVSNALDDHGPFDAGLHFAALIEAGESMHTPERFFCVNTAGSAVLLEQPLRRGIRRFVLSSTAAVYGEPACHDR